MSRNRRERKKAVAELNAVYTHYYDLIFKMATSRFEWENLPNGCDERTLEKTLFTNKMCALFYDDVLGYLALPAVMEGGFDVNGDPLSVNIYSRYNGYHTSKKLGEYVPVYNNDIRKPLCEFAALYAKRLYQIDCILSQNLNAQKKPYLIIAPQDVQLTLDNILNDLDNNVSSISLKNSFDMDWIKSLNLNAPYICDKLVELKNSVWNEMLTQLGIGNTSVQKKERVIRDEVMQNMGGVLINRETDLLSRKRACKLAKQYFGLDIDVHFNDFLDGKEVMIDE